MLINDKKTQDVLGKQIHKHLKKHHKSLSLKVFKAAFDEYLGKNPLSQSTDVLFFHPVSKLGLSNHFEELGMDCSLEIIEKGFMDCAFILSDAKNATRSEISKAKMAKPYRLFNSTDLVNREEFEGHHYAYGFSLHSFAANNALSLDDACLKIQGMLNKKIVRCIGYDDQNIPYFKLNDLYEYVMNKNHCRKAMQNIKRTQFFSCLDESLRHQFNNEALAVTVNGISVVGHFEADDKISGAMVISVNTDVDVSHLSTNVNFINSLLKHLSAKVKNADQAIGYVHFENTFLKPKEFLNTHLLFDPATALIVNKTIMSSYVDRDWDDSLSQFVREYGYYANFSNQLNGIIKECLSSGYSGAFISSDFEYDNNPVENKNIAIFLGSYFTNIGVVSYDKTPAHLISLLDKDTFSWRPKSISSSITDLQIKCTTDKMYFSNEDIKYMGQLNWCIEQSKANKKKLSTHKRKKKANYYLYYDLKCLPATLVGIGSTTTNPIDFFRRSDRELSVVKVNYAEISVQPCSEETIDAVDNIFKSNKHHMKMIRLLDEKTAMLPAQRFGYREQDGLHIFDAKLLKAPVKNKIKPIVYLHNLDLKSERYSDDEIEAMQHHIRIIHDYTMLDVLNNNGDAVLLESYLSAACFTASDSGWEYSYQRDDKWAKLKVCGDQVRISIQGEEKYELHYVTDLDTEKLNLFFSWLPVIITLFDVMNFNFKECDERNKLHDMKSLNEIEPDVFEGFLSENFITFNDRFIDRGWFGRMMSKPHIVKAELA